MLNKKRALETNELIGGNLGLVVFAFKKENQGLYDGFAEEVLESVVNQINTMNDPVEVSSELVELGLALTVLLNDTAIDSEDFILIDNFLFFQAYRCCNTICDRLFFKKLIYLIVKVAGENIDATLLSFFHILSVHLNDVIIELEQFTFPNVKKVFSGEEITRYKNLIYGSTIIVHILTKYHFLDSISGRINEILVQINSNKNLEILRNELNQVLLQVMNSLSLDRINNLDDEKMGCFNEYKDVIGMECQILDSLICMKIGMT
ncbi:hypothetical protein [Pedobacter gandavensis]|uniref:hypothetical protein n=1 Tax=Pedobacter gandavensis TaxID=2679963 RepID=UPI00292E4EDF|nr:hypothetical protein [Pedobacter gandavensis]